MRPLIAHEVLFPAAALFGTIVRLFVLWLVARVAYVASRGPVLARMPDAAFAAARAWHVVPRPFVAATTPRNLALPGILAGSCVAAVAFDIAGSRARSRGPGRSSGWVQRPQCPRTRG